MTVKKSRRRRVGSGLVAWFAIAAIVAAGLVGWVIDSVGASPDADLDGQITIVDVQAVVNGVLAGTTGALSPQLDVDGDSQVNVVDVQRVVAEILQIPRPPMAWRPTFGQASVGQTFTHQFQSSGGVPPVSWSVGGSSALPPGLVLLPTGALSGTPTAAGSHVFTVSVTDAANATHSRQVELVVGGSAPGPANRVVMAYAENLWGAGGSPAISAFDYSAVTHVIHGFVLPDANGGLTQHSNFQDFRTGGGWMPQTLPAAVHAAGKKIVVSIGGALPATNATNFAAIASSPSIRQTFISNVVTSIAAWGYDGVDIDYEWPDNVLQGQQFTVLMQELYTALKQANPNHLVVFGAGPGDKVGYKQWAQLSQWCDYCFFFGYDWHWGFAPPAPVGPISNPGTTFVASSGPSFERSVRGAVNYVLGQGFPASKLVIGLPYYSADGITWSGGGRATWQGLTPSQRQDVHPEYREVLMGGRWWTTPEAMPLKLDALLKPSTSVLRDAGNNPVVAAGIGWWEWGCENPAHGELTAAVKTWLAGNP